MRKTRVILSFRPEDYCNYQYLVVAVGHSGHWLALGLIILGIPQCRYGEAVVILRTPPTSFSKCHQSRQCIYPNLHLCTRFSTRSLHRFLSFGLGVCRIIGMCRVWGLCKTLFLDMLLPWTAKIILLRACFKTRNSKYYIPLTYHNPNMKNSFIMPFLPLKPKTPISPQKYHRRSPAIPCSFSMVWRAMVFSKLGIVDKNGNGIQTTLSLLSNYSTIMSKAKNIKPKVIEDSEEDSDSSIPIIAAKPTKKEKVEEKKAVKKVAKPASSDEEDTPVVEKKPTKQQKTDTAPKKVVPVAKKPAKQESSEEESEEEAPKKVVAKAKSPVQKPVVQKKKPQPESSEESSEEEAPKPQPKGKLAKVASPVQKAVSPSAKVTKKPAPVVESSESEEESEEKPAPKKAAVKSPVQKVKSPVQKAKSPVQKPQPAKKAASSSEESEEEVKKPVAKKGVVATKPAPKKVESESEQQSEEVVKPAPKKGAVAAKPAPKKVESSQSEEEEKPAPKKVVGKAAAKPVKKPEPIEEEEEKPAMEDENDEEGLFEVCVRGLSFQAYDSDIRSLFETCGNVLEVKLLTRDDGKSKGTAFVKFNKKSAFNKALELSGSEHLGRSIIVEESQGKKPFNNGGSFGGNQRGGFNQRGGQQGGKSYPQPGSANIETPTLFIGGLSYNSTADSIRDFFSHIGEVSSARVVTDKETGKPRGFGYVEFHDVDTAKKAYKELNGGELDGRSIRLDSASQRDRPQGGFGGQGGYGGQGGFGGGFGGNRGGSRNPGNSTVVLSQDDKNAKKGSIGTFAGKKMAL